MACADPVQQVVHDLVVEPVADGAPDAGGANPPLLPQHTERLGHSVLRPAQRGRKVADADARRAVQAEQNLQTVRILQEVESLGPHSGVDVRQRRRRTLDLWLIPWLIH